MSDLTFLMLLFLGLTLGGSAIHLSRDAAEKKTVRVTPDRYIPSCKWLCTCDWQSGIWIRMGSIVVGGRWARYERLRFDRASICNKLSSIEKAASPVMRMSGFFLFKL